jgi:hypothetical protein
MPLVVAGALSLLGAAIHGGAGEVLVVRKLSTAALPSSPFGGPGMTKSMIRVSWHLTTMAFVAVGTAFVLSGSVLDGDAAHGIGLLATATSTGFAALVLGTGAVQASRSIAKRDWRLVLHPAPGLFIAVVVLAWTGIT